ncbi:uncharacterized protein N7473_006422 [Penicillium subrubescens]|uniref:uncharacterized protein n=1 Tax=Penicillium subrubescens TaxID=1316194 RepID=UPI0025454B72|nr:uncharacterized protein N7473_006422 [Penicillium subrubescens]KAJ5897023.1 hypothetical protein N7473_006422 [Penicillium subrubescens]
MKSDALIPRSENGDFQRPGAQFRDAVSPDPDGRFPAESGRYHLYVSYACPWAHRTLIVRKLKGLENIVGVTVVHPHMSLVEGWRFYNSGEGAAEEGCVPDPLHPGVKRLKELYLKADPGYSGRFSVPVLWDKTNGTIVNNESSEIIRILNSAFNHLLPPETQKIDIYPPRLQFQIDSVNLQIYENINNGVYKCGLAKSQQAYDRAIEDLFNQLDAVESHLQVKHNGGPFYFGRLLTETDIRLFVTVVRFDIVYYNLFKTNRKLIRFDYPNIHRWMQNLYWNISEFRWTTNIGHIKQHYFSLTILNPWAIVPDGPLPEVVPIS